jgi:photosystem II stability/assembly factor-like uncharacterized protein
MAAPWRRMVVRRLGMPFGLLLVTTTLTGCLGWFTQYSTTDGSMLGGVSCPSTTVCFAVGNSASGNALVEQTTDAGGHWVTNTNGVTGLGLNAISCPDVHHCVAVGGVSEGGIIRPSNTVLVTTDGGANWSASTLPSVDGYLTSVSCPDVQHCWATSAVGIVGFSKVIATADGGTSWTVLNWSAPPLPDNQSSPMSSQLNAMTCTTTSDCLTVGEVTYETTLDPPQVTQGVISTTHDGGATWHSQLVADDIIGISCPNAQSCVAMGQNTVDVEQSSPYRIVTSDGGSTWTISTPPYSGQIDGGNAPVISAISCSNPLRCSSVGVVFDNNKYETPVIATADGGATWSNQPAPIPTGARLEAVSCVSDSSCWTVGFTSSGAVILHTINGGASSPTVTVVSPNEGPGTGGTPVTVTGAGFKFGVLKVLFGSGAATNVTVVSDSELRATVPFIGGGVVPSPGTTVDVSVTTVLGTSPVNPGDQFTYLSSTSPGVALSLTSTSPGASCDNTNPGSPVCIGMASGTVVAVNGTGFSPGALVWSAQCNSDPSQPMVLFLGAYIPVSCSRLALTTIPSSGSDKGDLSGTQTLGAGTIGPPGMGLTPTCTDGSATIPGCTTSGNAEIDAASYPCPPTAAQQAAGDSCVIAISDTAGDHAVGIVIFGHE